MNSELLPVNANFLVGCFRDMYNYSTKNKSVESILQLFESEFYITEFFFTLNVCPLDNLQFAELLSMNEYIVDSAKKSFFHTKALTIQ